MAKIYKKETGLSVSFCVSSRVSSPCIFWNRPKRRAEVRHDCMAFERVYGTHVSVMRVLRCQVINQHTFNLLSLAVHILYVYIIYVSVIFYE